MNNFIERLRSIKKPALVTVIVVLMSFAMAAFLTGVMHYRNDVVITQDGVTKTFFTMKQGSEEILAEFGYTVGEFDRIIHERNSGGSDRIEIIGGFGVEIVVDSSSFTGSAIPGEEPHVILATNSVQLGRYDAVIVSERKLEVIRGFSVNITADGQTVTLGTIGSNVADLLNRAEIVLTEHDVVNMPLDAYVLEGAHIVVNRVSYRNRADVEYIDYEIITQYSDLVAIGDVKVTGGIYGENTVVYHEKLVDGQVVHSQVLSNQLTKEPVTKVVNHGRALSTPISQREFPEITLVNGRPVNYIAKHTGSATAYSFYEISSWSTGKTASGRKLEVGTIAVNPQQIPYGSLVYIVSDCGWVYGAAVAADTGGFARKPNNVIVDLFMGFTRDDYLEALQWGSRNVSVYVINTGVY
jgi:uncharacterized protein YabE (DUF348 family)/3D (Asp-Asp-Asp) domain-containing protein